jgi:L-lactate dehydrogenase complex protein LldG
MNSREEILNAVVDNQPINVPLPEIGFLDSEYIYLAETFINTLTGIGGNVVPVENMLDVQAYILQKFYISSRTVTTVRSLKNVAELLLKYSTPSHGLNNIDYAIIDSHCAVAENGAVWVTEKGIGYNRVLPFICQHLAVVVNARDIVPNMHAAYEVINTDDYGYGTFIAGPSKTADIEQSLVLGAHGPRSMTVFLMM